MKNVIFDLKQHIDTLLETDNRVIIAIDGNCTAGKTTLAAELEKGTAPDVQVCVYTLLTRLEPPKLLRRQLAELGATLGRFDLPGQLRGLEHAIRSTEEALRTVRDGAEGRRRSWQTLGLCAGAALAILFV